MLECELHEQDPEITQKQHCGICLCEYQPKETIKITNCNHSIHKECLIPWLEKSNLCPICWFKFD